MELLEKFFELGMMALVLIYAHRRPEIFTYIVAGLVTCLISMSWMADYPVVGFVFFALGLYQLLNMVILATSGGAAKGMSQFRGIIGKIKGIGR